MDGVTFAQIEAEGVEEWLASLREELASRMYRAAPVRRVMIPKPGGGERPLGIPTIRDRVVQTAAKLVLEPIFEADFEDGAYGYRPGRSATDAIKEVHRLICRGYTDVVDADLSKYFDTIPHADLLKSVARRISDGHVLWLIKLWLKAPVEERDGDGKRRMSGGKDGKRGTPQGGVASPLLANIYMNRFLKHWRLSGRGEAFRAHIVNYADDFVILSQRRAAEALAWTKAAMARLGPTLNEVKTSVKDARTERFDFLGYSFGPHCYQRNGNRYLGASPTEKSVKRVKTKVSEVLVPGNVQAWPEVCGRLNSLLRGWAAYFCYGTRNRAYKAGTGHTKPLIITSADASGISSDGGIRYPVAEPSSSPATLSLGDSEFRRWITAVGLATKPVGERSAGNLHAAFDERGGEPDRRCDTAPLLDSTDRITSRLPSYASYLTQINDPLAVSLDARNGFGFANGDAWRLDYAKE